MNVPAAQEGVMIASEWSYVGEGKVRIALENRCICSEHYGLVLLLTKEDNRHTMADNDQQLKFVKSTMVRLFSTTYLPNTSQAIELADEFVTQLVAHISSRRPAGRKRSTEPVVISNSACLLRNFGMIYHSPQYTNIMRSPGWVTVELKVKGGMKGSSPFIPLHRSIKLCTSRFQLMQCQKILQASQSKDGVMAWGKFVARSEYKPEQLCSGDLTAVMQALSALMVTPQNNLRVSVNGAHIYGWEKVDVERFHQALRDCDALREDSGRSAREVLLQVLAHILTQERILRILLSVQDLDVIDVEGAAMVYARLLSLFSGDTHHTNAYITERMAEPIPLSITSTSSISHSADYSNSSEPPHACRTVPEDVPRSICDIVIKLRALRVDENTPAVERLARCAAAELLVSLADREECALLLQLFMVSLIAKDASVMVSLQACAPGDCPGSSLAAMAQTPEHCGIATLPAACRGDMPCAALQAPASGQPGGFLYSVGLIDVGLKALDKLWAKELEEDAVCIAAEAVLGRANT